MANIAKINVSGLDYNIKDNDAREHVARLDNPHKVSAEQLHLKSFENESPESILNRINKTFIEDVFGYPLAKQSDLDNKLDKTGTQDQEVQAVTNFINGIKINGALITYNSATDTIIFS